MSFFRGCTEDTLGCKLPELLKKSRAKIKTKKEERKGKEAMAKQRGEEDGSLMGVRCSRMIQSKLTSHQPRHQQKSVGEKDERR